MFPEPLRIFIGYDERERDAYEVCRYSLRKHSSVPLAIEPVDQNALRRAGLYRRTTRLGEGRIDLWDGKPFSTAFAFSRFIVPALAQYRGLALFVDCDFLFRADVAQVFACAHDRYPVMCVQHAHKPGVGVKMDGQRQENYERKNWSSLMLFNAGHSAHENLTVDDVNLRPGAWLHGFGWIPSTWQIGRLDPRWNYLVGHSDRIDTGEPGAVHFTSGVPSMPGYENCEYADEWRVALAEARAQ